MNNLYLISGNIKKILVTIIPLYLYGFLFIFPLNTWTIKFYFQSPQMTARHKQTWKENQSSQMPMEILISTDAIGIIIDIGNHPKKILIKEETFHKN